VSYILKSYYGVVVMLIIYNIRYYIFKLLVQFLIMSVFLLSIIRPNSAKNMESARNSYGVPLGFLWNSTGIHRKYNILVDSSGFHRDSSRLHMEYLWIPVDSLGKTTFQCGLSMEIPYGMTSFLMESTGIHWNESGPNG
jgi:hypothetical protein